MGIHYETVLNRKLDCIDMFLVRQEINVIDGEDGKNGQDISAEILGRLYREGKRYSLKVPIKDGPDKFIAFINTCNRERAIRVSKRIFRSYYHQYDLPR